MDGLFRLNVVDPYNLGPGGMEATASTFSLLIEWSFEKCVYPSQSSFRFVDLERKETAQPLLLAFLQWVALSRESRVGYRIKSAKFAEHPTLTDDQKEAGATTLSVSTVEQHVVSLRRLVSHR